MHNGSDEGRLGLTRLLALRTGASVLIGDDLLFSYIEHAQSSCALSESYPQAATA